MNEFDKKRYRAALHKGVAIALISGGFTSLSAPANAQIADQIGEQEEEAVEQIVITGSRIKRDAFSSTTPLQVLDAEEATRLGVTTVSELLQRSTTSSGKQIDFSINTNAGNSNATEAPPTGGIGSSNIDLRGLGPERTLVLVNGRRFGLAGARGAPAQPDINLLPLGLVENIDILTGGASTVYGADAVAGVVNVKLKSDFDGIDISGGVRLPEAGGGEVYRASLVAGVSNDRGNITLGFDYFTRERASTGSRDFTNCLRTIEETEDGQIFDFCRSGFFDNVIALNGLDPVPGVEGTPFVFFTPGTTNLGVPNFSTGDALPRPTDPDVDGQGPRFDDGANGRRRFPFIDFYGDQDERRNADLIRPEERFSLVVNGHYDLDWGNNERFYFEGYYFNRQNNVIAATEQVFPTISATIAQEVRDADGNFVDFVRDGSGNIVQFDNPLNPFDFDATPIVTLDDVPQTFDVEVQQFRAVAGFSGDIGTQWFEERKWSYDSFFSYDRGVGFQSQPILLEDRLIEGTQSTRLDPDGNVVCGNTIRTDSFNFLTPNECVPIDFFAESIYTDGEGRFSTQAERDFLVGTRTNRTVTEQFNAGINATGEILDLPTGGPVSVAFGAEWRYDRISSTVDAIGATGGNSAENPTTEGATVGSRWIYDLYGEVSIPILEGLEFAELVQLDGSVRYTEEENFGDEVTWRVGGIYRPTEFVAFTASYNTSFRAPNLREQFLADQFNGVSGNVDPCLNQNINELAPGATADRIIANCIASGADVTVLGTGGITTIPVQVGGSDELQAETSDSFVASVQLSQPWTDSFSFDLAITYFDISLENTVEELDPEIILSRCFSGEVGLTSPFCRLVERNNPNATPSANLISSIDASFINIGQETSKGIDIVTRFGKTFDNVFGETLDLNWATSSTYLIEQERQVFADSALIDNAGRIGNPEWLLQSTVTLDWDFLQFSWQTRFIDAVAETEDDEDTTRVFTDSPEIPGTVATAPLDHVGARVYNDVSLTADFETYSLTFGINNLTDQDPPLIDRNLSGQRNNAVTQSGYDLFGRTFFMNARVRF